MGEGKNVRLQVIVDAEVAEKIERLADRLAISQSKMAAWILEEGLLTEEWIIRMISSRVTQALVPPVKKAITRRRKARDEGKGEEE